MSEHHEKTLSGEQLSIPDGHLLRKMPLIAGVIGIVGLVLAFVFGKSDMDEFWRAYHVAFVYFLSFALGGTFFVLIHFASKAGWGIAVRRIAESMMATFPLFLILFIPTAIMGIDVVFEAWVTPDPHNHLVQGKLGFLNEKFFLIRAGIYLAIWNVLAYFYYKNSTRQDETGDPELTRRMSFWSPLGIALFALSLTGAAFDWIMAVDPNWFSTVFGIYYFAGCVIACYAVMSIVAIAMKKTGLANESISKEHLHDLGKMMFAFTVFWAYIAFSQYMLYWYANLPEETYWFNDRWKGGWQTASYVLAIGHFVVPFFFLMSRHIKRRVSTLLVGAIWMLIIHAVDMYWLIMPAFENHEGVVGLGPVHIAVFVGIGGLWVAVLTWLMGRAKLYPVKDPRLSESLAFENA